MEDGATLGWKSQEEAAADDNGRMEKLPKARMEKRSHPCEALAAGSANILEMLIVAAVVNCHRQLRKVTHTQLPR